MQRINRQRGKVAEIVGRLRRSHDAVERSVLAARARKAQANLDALVGGEFERRATQQQRDIGRVTVAIDGLTVTEFDAA